jgi:hypothetical protein
VELYHRTSEEVAARILDEGFRDGEPFMDSADGKPIGGVWLSSIPHVEPPVGPLAEFRAARAAP